MVDIRKHKAQFWQPKLSDYNTLIAGEQEIHQSINVILNTPRGSVPHRPTFGCDLYKYIDLPVDEATPGILQEIVLSLTVWEPRIKVLDISPRVINSNVIYTVNYTILSTDQVDSIEVAL